MRDKRWNVDTTGASVQEGAWIKSSLDAKQYSESWIKEQIFIQDVQNAIYPYWQEFSVGQKNYHRRGFICLVRLEELGKGNILPHEKTLSKPKADRLNLLRITKKDFEPVFLLYTDPENYVNGLIEKECKKSPLVEVMDEKNVDDTIQTLYQNLNIK